MRYDKNINPALLQQQLGEIGLSAKNLETLSRWSMRAEFYLPDDPNIDAIVQAHDHTQKTAQQTQTEQAEAALAVLEARLKTIILGNIHMLNWANMIIPFAAFGVATIAGKAENPVQTHLGMMTVFNGTTADQYDPQRRMLDNLAYTVWMRNLTYFSAGDWSDVRQEVLDALLSPTPSLEIISMTFAAFQVFAATNSLQMVVPGLAQVAVPQLVTP